MNHLAKPNVNAVLMGGSVNVTGLIVMDDQNAG